MLSAGFYIANIVQSESEKQLVERDNGEILFPSLGSTCGILRLQLQCCLSVSNLKCDDLSHSDK
jgi:hypothetical protein